MLVISVLLVSVAVVAVIYVIVMTTLTRNVRKATRQDEQRYKDFLIAMNNIQQRNPQS